MGLFIRRGMERQHLNRHHLLFERTAHSANVYNKTLRNSMGLVALIDVEAHKELHRSCPPVPPLSPYVAQRARNLYIPSPHPLRGIDGYLTAVQEAVQHPSTHEIERRMAELTMQAVEIQKPFVVAGLAGIESTRH
jgi:hypothetical protein